MPAELRPEGDGWTCPEHPDYAPRDLEPRHAANSMAKHNRENHDGEAVQEDLERLTAIIVNAVHPAASVTACRAAAEAVIANGWHRAPF